MLDLLKDAQNLSCPLFQCCAKSGKTMPGSGGQEWPSNIPIEFII